MSEQDAAMIVGYLGVLLVVTAPMVAVIALVAAHMRGRVCVEHYLCVLAPPGVYLAGAAFVHGLHDNAYGLSFVPLVLAALCMYALAAHEAIARGERAALRRSLRALLVVLVLGAMLAAALLPALPAEARTLRTA